MKSIRLSNNVYVDVLLHELRISLAENIISSEVLGPPDFKKQANKYIDALGDHYCVAFLEELHKVCAQRIVKHWEEVSPDQLKNKHYKQYLKFKDSINK